jgi:hypothetical protein
LDISRFFRTTRESEAPSILVVGLPLARVHGPRENTSSPLPPHRSSTDGPTRSCEDRFSCTGTDPSLYYQRAGETGRIILIAEYRISGRQGDGEGSGGEGQGNLVKGIKLTRGRCGRECFVIHLLFDSRQCVINTIVLSEPCPAFFCSFFRSLFPIPTGRAIRGADDNRGEVRSGLITVS